MGQTRSALVLVLVSFLGSFAFIRLSARLSRSERVPWWPGSVVSDSGLHLHHLVWGICLMLTGGVLSFALVDAGAWFAVSACVFGIGAGLTIDEFALWVYLDDVYWAPEGRHSIDAAVIAGTAMLLLVVSGRPITIDGTSAADVIAGILVVATLLAFVVVSFAKHRLLHGAIGAFFPPIAIYGAVRIGKPGSPWAKRFYGERRPRKQAKAARRFRAGRRTDHVKERFRDAVGGPTDAVYQARLAERAARREAASEIRQRAERVTVGSPDAEGPPGPGGTA